MAEIEAETAEPLEIVRQETVAVAVSVHELYEYAEVTVVGEEYALGGRGYDDGSDATVHAEAHPVSASAVVVAAPVDCDDCDGDGDGEGDGYEIMDASATVVRVLSDLDLDVGLGGIGSDPSRPGTARAPPPHPAAAPSPHDDVSPYLYDLTRQGASLSPTSSGGWDPAQPPPDRRDWGSVSRLAESAPHLARYLAPDPSFRSPLHEACRLNAPPGVIRSILAAHPKAAELPDGVGNLPLHLLFSGSGRRRRFFRGNSNSYSDSDSSVNGDSNSNSNGIDARSSSGPTTTATATTLANMSDFDVRRYESALALISAYPDTIGAPNGQGDTPLMHACDFPPSSPLLIEALTSSFPPASRVLDQSGRTALARYCDAGGTSPYVARILIESFPEALRAVDYDGRTPLHRPAYFGNADVVETLLLRDDDHIASKRTRRGSTALHEACAGIGGDDYDSDYVRTVSLLLRSHRGAASVLNKDGTVPIRLACRNRNPSLRIVNALLRADPSCGTIVCTRTGWNALHDACDHSGGGRGETADASDQTLVEIVRSLLRRGGEREGVSSSSPPCDPDMARAAASIVTIKLDSPLHLAAEQSDPRPNLGIVRELLGAYPGVVFLRNDYGYTPLHCACQSYIPDEGLVRALLGAGSRLQLRCARLGSGEIESDGDEHVDEFDKVALLKTNNGEMALHLAVSKAQVPIGVIEALLEAQGDDNCDDDDDGASKNKAGNTPLHEACYRHSNANVIRALAHGRPRWASTRNASGYTPLFLMCKFGMATVDAVRVLLEVGGEDGQQWQQRRGDGGGAKEGGEEVGGSGGG